MSVKLDLMRSGVIILPGGIDTSAHLLFMFPVHALSLIHIRYSGAHLMTLVQQYLDHVPASLRGRGFSFLIDMSSLNKDSVQVVVEMVEKLQCETPNLVYALYAVAPKNKDALKMLKKLITPKSSKKSHSKLSFQTLVVNNKSDLNSHIDTHQRTPDYGGNLRYNHTAYTKLVQTYDSLKEKIAAVQYKLPAAQDKVLMLQEYEIPSKLEAREALLTQVTNKYHNIMRDLDIESCIDECRVIIEKLKMPEKEPEFTEIMMSPLFGVAKDTLEIKHKELTSSRQGLQALWQQAEERVSSSNKIGKYRAKAEKVLEWLDDIGFPTVRQEVEVADCLSKAELYKHHFEAGFHGVAQNVVWLSEKLIRKLEGCVLQDKHSHDGQNMLEFSRTFHSTVSTFRKEVESKRQLYENVHQFFLTSDKLSVWYERSLTFLPFHLLTRHTAHSVDIQHPPQDVFYPSDTWVQALENYLMYNPAPKSALLSKLKNILPVIDNLSVRNQARILVHRIEVLTQVMSHPKLIPTMHQELSDILRWKTSVKQDMDDVLFELTNSHRGSSTLGTRFGGSDSTGLHQLDLSLPPTSMASTLSLNRSNTPSIGSLDGILMAEKPSRKSKDRPKKPKRKNLALKGYNSIDSLDNIDGKGSSDNLTPGDSTGSGDSPRQPIRSRTPANLHSQAPVHLYNTQESAHFHSQAPAHLYTSQELSSSHTQASSYIHAQAPAHLHIHQQRSVIPGTGDSPQQPIRSRTPANLHTQAPAHLHTHQQRSVTPGALKQQMLARAAKKAASNNTGGTHYGSAPNIATGELRVTFEDHLGAEIAPDPESLAKSRSVSNPHIPKLDLSFLQNAAMTNADSQQALMRQKSYKVYGESRRKLTNSSTSSGSYLYMDSIPESSDGLNMVGRGGEHERYVSLDVPESPKTAPVEGQNFWGEGEKQQRKTTITKRTRSASPKYYAKLLANEKGDLPLSLTLSESGGFDLTQSNVETVVQSNLNAEEKLTIMSSMCKVNGAKGSDNSSNSIQKGNPGANKDLPNGNVKQNGVYSDLLIGSTQYGNGRSDSVEDIQFGTKHNSVNEDASYDTKEVEEKVNVLTNKTTANMTGINRKDRKALKKKSPAVQVQISKNDTDATSGKSSSSTLEPKLPLTAPPMYNNKNHMKVPYGIDIEAWIDRQHSERYIGDQSVDSSSVELASSSGTEALEECRTKFQQARANRLHEEQLLEKERRRLRDLEIEQQALKQAEVERALRRAERMLQEQELKLQNDSKNISGSKGQHSSEAVAPPVVHVRTNSTGNASEESGIFTQTSQDSVARTLADNMVVVTQSGMTSILLTSRSDPQSSRDEVTYSSSKSDWDSAFDNMMNADTTMVENSEISSALTNEIAGGGSSAYYSEHLTQNTTDRQYTEEGETSDTEDYSQGFDQLDKGSDGDLTTTTFPDDGTEDIIVKGLPSSLDFNKSEAYTTESNSSFTGTVQSMSNDSVLQEEKSVSTVTSLTATDDYELLLSPRSLLTNDSEKSPRKTRQSSNTRKNPLLPKGISPQLQLVEISLEELTNHKLKGNGAGPRVKNNLKSVPNTRQVDFRDMLKQAKKDVRAKRTGSTNSEKDLFSSFGKDKNYNLDQHRKNESRLEGNYSDSVRQEVPSHNANSSHVKDGYKSNRLILDSNGIMKHDGQRIKPELKVNSKSDSFQRNKRLDSHVMAKAEADIDDTSKVTGKITGDGVGFEQVVCGSLLNSSKPGESGGGGGGGIDKELNQTGISSKKDMNSNPASKENYNNSQLETVPSEADRSNANRVVVASTPRTSNELKALDQNTDQCVLPIVTEEIHSIKTCDAEPEEKAEDCESEKSLGEVMLESDLNDTMLSSIMGFDHDICVNEESTDVEDNNLDQPGSFYKEEEDDDDASIQNQEVNQTRSLQEQEGDGNSMSELDEGDSHDGSYYNEEDEEETDENDDDTKSLPELEVYSYMQDLQDDIIEEETLDEEEVSGGEHDDTLNNSRGFNELCDEGSERKDEDKDICELSKDMMQFHRGDDAQTTSQVLKDNIPQNPYINGDMNDEVSSRSAVYEVSTTSDLPEEATSSQQDETFHIKGLSTQEFLDINDVIGDNDDTTTEDVSFADTAPTETCLDDTMPTETCLDDTMPTDTCLDDTLPSGVAFLTELGEKDFDESSQYGCGGGGGIGEGRGITLEDSGEGRMLCSAGASPSPACLTSEVVRCLQTPVIIDNGSGLCKCGFAGDDQPSATFPAYVGRPKYNEIMSKAYKDCYVGSSAQNMRGMLQLKYPLEHGIVTDWDDMEKIWEHAFSDQLRVDPSEQPVLLTEAPLNPRRHRERMMEMMFETFHAPALYVAVQAMLALYASGRTTGVVLDIGDGVSHVVPVYEGYTLPHAIQRIDLAGRDLTHYLMTLMYDSGYSFTTTAERDIARDIKERLCYVAGDYEAELQRAQESVEIEGHYTMPDGRGITLGTERFRCTEALFQPALLGKEHGGIHHSIYNCVSKCDLDLKRDLLSNVVLSGGSTLFEGLPSRLQSDLSLLYNSESLAQSIKITSPAERRFLVWRGASVLANLDSFASSWVLQEEYQEYGVDIIHRKCF